MIILDTSEIIEIHKMLIAATGGSSGIRDINLLDSAVSGCYQTFDGVDLYPTVVEKAARIAYTLCKNHPFVDGNKRIAVTSMLVMLRLNQISLSFSQQELIILGLGIANGELEYENILCWINSHLDSV